MQNVIAQIKTTTEDLGKITQFRSPHLEAAAAQLRAAGDSLANHCAWLKSHAADLEKQIQGAGPLIQEQVTALEALKAAVAAANPAPEDSKLGVAFVEGALNALAASDK